MSTVGNIGIGLLILIIVWIFALLAFVIAVRLQNNLGWVSLATATLLTIILVVIPTETLQTKAEDSFVEKDYSHIYQSVLFAFLTISVILGFIAFFILHCIEPVRPKLIKS